MKPEIQGEISAPLPLCPHQILRRVLWEWTRSSAFSEQSSDHLELRQTWL